MAIKIPIGSGITKEKVEGVVSISYISLSIGNHNCFIIYLSFLSFTFQIFFFISQYTKKVVGYIRSCFWVPSVVEN